MIKDAAVTRIVKRLHVACVWHEHPGPLMYVEIVQLINFVQAISIRRLTEAQLLKRVAGLIGCKYNRRRMRPT